MNLIINALLFWFNYQDFTVLTDIEWHTINRRASVLSTVGYKSRNAKTDQKNREKYKSALNLLRSQLHKRIEKLFYSYSTVLIVFDNVSFQVIMA